LIARSQLKRAKTINPALTATLLSPTRAPLKRNFLSVISHQSVRFHTYGAKREDSLTPRRGAADVAVVDEFDLHQLRRFEEIFRDAVVGAAGVGSPEGCLRLRMQP
jgi:hypothetical protein